MPVSRIQHDHIYFCIYQSAYPVQHIRRNANTSPAEQPSLFVLGGKRIFDRFFYIFYRNQSCQIIIFIYNRKFFFSRLCQNLFCFLQRDSFPRRNQAFRSHGFLYFFCKIRLEFQIAVGNDAHQSASFGNWHARDTELRHQSIRIL